MLLLAPTVSAGARQAATVPDAKDLIGKMFARYAGGKTVAGRIRMVQTAMNVTIQVDTTIALERPDLIHIEQRQLDGTKPQATLISDGVRFVYTAQLGTVKDTMRMMESLHPNSKSALHIPEIYPCVFTSLADRSFPLDVAVGRTADLKILTQHLAAFTMSGKSNVLGRDVYDIRGDWREANSTTLGSFDLYITPDGDFVRLERRANFGVNPKWLKDHRLPTNAYPDGIPVVSTWDGDLKVGVPIDHAEFAIRQGR